LIGEDLALLVCDRLTVDGKRVRRVVAESMKETVRIGCYTRRGQGYQRAQRRRLALQRQLIKQAAIDVGVKCRVVFQQIAGRNFNNCSLPTDNQSALDRERYGRPHVNVLATRSESFGVYDDMIWIQRKVGELIEALAVRRGSPGVAADWIFDRYGSIRHNSAGCICNCAVDGPAVPG
jgi:hypothetical protein